MLRCSQSIPKRTLLLVKRDYYQWTETFGSSSYDEAHRSSMIRSVPCCQHLTRNFHPNFKHRAVVHNIIPTIVLELAQTMGIV
jgi:hypothetical protein